MLPPDCQSDTDSVPEEYAAAEISGYAGRNRSPGLSDCGSMRFPGHELLCPGIPETERMHAGGIPEPGQVVMKQHKKQYKITYKILLALPCSIIIRGKAGDAGGTLSAALYGHREDADAGRSDFGKNR